MATESARLLLVEDEDGLRATMGTALARAGFAVEARRDGTDFEERLVQFRPDAVVLDVMLPGRSGLELAHQVRTRSEVAIVFVTAREAIEARLHGFEAGADDYIVKPFVTAELVARLRAVLRRSGRLVSAAVQVADVVVDEDAGRVWRGESEVALTATELRLLAYLCRNRERVLSKTQILAQIWGYDSYDPNLVETYVSSLRRKLEAEGGERIIHTVRGIGYRVGEPRGRRRR